LENKNIKIKIFRSIINIIDKFVIKEEEILSQEKDIDSFILLQGIEKEQLLFKCPELNETKYLINTLQLGNNFVKKCQNGDISYSAIYSIIINNEKKALLKERLNILFLNNQDDVETCLKLFEEKTKNITQVLGYIRKLLEVLKDFYKVKHQKNIKIIEDFEKQINEGKLNEIEKPENKSEYDKIHQILPDLDIKYDKLRHPEFFAHFFRKKKGD
jgi:hypothetical protein